MPTFKRQDQEQMEKAKDLLENGSSELGFVKSMFFGRLQLHEVMPFPTQDASESQRAADMIAKIDPFLKEKVDPDRIDAEEKIPKEVIDGLGKLGVLGMTVPKEFGGSGFSHTSYCRVLEHVSQHC